MDSTEFKDIQQYDVIEIYSKDGTREGSVLKDSDNRVLVGGIYKTVFGREKGFYQTVGPKDVIRIIKPFNAPVSEGDNTTAIKEKAISIIELSEEITDLA
jgi:hypothetical protein